MSARVDAAAPHPGCQRKGPGSLCTVMCVDKYVKLPHDLSPPMPGRTRVHHIVHQGPLPKRQRYYVETTNSSDLLRDPLVNTSSISSLKSLSIPATAPAAPHFAPLASPSGGKSQWAWGRGTATRCTRPGHRVRGWAHPRPGCCCELSPQRRLTCCCRCTATPAPGCRSRSGRRCCRGRGLV